MQVYKRLAMRTRQHRVILRQIFVNNLCVVDTREQTGGQTHWLSG